MSSVNDNPDAGSEEVTEGTSGFSAEDNRVFGLVHRVLTTPLLLEMILDNAIREEGDDEGNLSPDYIQSCRLVQKTWKEAVTKVLRYNREPLYKAKFGKRLNKFTKFLLGIRATEGRIPTFSLEIEDQYFIQRNFGSIINFMQKCGDGLVELKLSMEYAGNKGTLPGMFSGVNLPLLKKLVVRLALAGYPLMDDPNGLMVVDPEECVNVASILESLLRGCQSLKEMSIDCCDCCDIKSLTGIQDITLPLSLTKIQLGFPLLDRELEVLLNNPLPCLQDLVLTAEGNYNSETLLVRILNKFRTTLCTLKFNGGAYTDPPKRPTFLHFPTMEKLKTLEMNSIFVGVEEDVPSISALFPKLEELALFEQTPRMLQKWTVGTPVASVKELALELVYDATLSIDQNVMERVNRMFPNVTKMYLRVSGDDASGLKYMFKEMGRLQKLSIHVVGRWDSRIEGTEYWDSVLLGASIEVVQGLSEGKCVWNPLNENDGEPSIRMLYELTNLTLETLEEKELGIGKPIKPMISDLSFVYGLLKMPKLINLNLNGRFLTSNTMTEEWKKRGRKIMYWD